MKFNGWIVCLIVVAVSVGGLGFGLAWRQCSWRQGFTKTTAHVRQAQMIRSHLGGHRPRITYVYDFAGGHHTAARFAPIPLVGTVGWARRIEKTYPIDATVEVFVDPDQPSRAYLRPTSLFYPYGFMLAAISLFAIGLVWARKRALAQRAAEPNAGNSHGWVTHRPATTPLGDGAWMFFGSLGYLGLCAAVSGHYLANLGPSYDRLTWLAVGFGLAGLVWLGLALRRLRAGSAFGGMSLRTTSRRIPLDSPIVTQLTLPLRRTVAVHEVRLTLVCVRRHGGVSSRIFSTSHLLAHDQTLNAGDNLVGDVCFTVPGPKRRPSRHAAAPSGEARGEFTAGAAEIRWCFDLQVRFAGRANTRIVFPVEPEVQDADPSIPSGINMPSHRSPYAKAA